MVVGGGWWWWCGVKRKRDLRTDGKVGFYRKGGQKELCGVFRWAWLEGRRSAVLGLNVSVMSGWDGVAFEKAGTVSDECASMT